MDSHSLIHSFSDFYWETTTSWSTIADTWNMALNTDKNPYLHKAYISAGKTNSNHRSKYTVCSQISALDNIKQEMKNGSGRGGSIQIYKDDKQMPGWWDLSGD